jgi:hypothetical protein
MATRDMHNGVKYTRALSPLTQTNADTAFVTQIIDTAGYESLEFVIQLGAMTDADVTAVVLVEDGDNSSLNDNAAVADAYLLGTETAAAFQFGDDLGIRKIGYVGSKRYVRMTITPTGNNSGALPIAVLAVQGHARHMPTATLADA